MKPVFNIVSEDMLKIREYNKLIEPKMNPIQYKTKSLMLHLQLCYYVICYIFKKTYQVDMNIDNYNTFKNNFNNISNRKYYLNSLK